MPVQQPSQTAPSSGYASVAPQAAHGGSNSFERTRLAADRHFTATVQATGLPGESVWNLCPCGVAPESIEPVKVASVLRKDVDDEVEIIDEDPLGPRVPFDVRRSLLLSFECLFHRIGNGLHLSRIRARADHEEISERAGLPQIEHDDIHGFLVARRLDHGLDRFRQAKWGSLS